MFFVFIFMLWIVSCIQNSLNEIDLSKYKDVDIYEDDEIIFKKPKKARNNH